MLKWSNNRLNINSLQEYQRAVIFRLGRVKKGGAVGPGLFWIIPCIDSIQVRYLIYKTLSKGSRKPKVLFIGPAAFFEALKKIPQKMWLSSREGGGKALVAGPLKK